ncbi:unnamed protein product (mitochondrion) [Plasmodiophora brassicae]|uniref:Wings apart-like protein C-terminal domain-containing protein n=2 Tax=Plasmodiophora brassicae TaxID=37360 RepID=A0A3P3YCN8_PLABS|nr:unnamed protein product [Plasmodiophora brassicae]
MASSSSSWAALDDDILYHMSGLAAAAPGSSGWRASAAGLVGMCAALSSPDAWLHLRSRMAIPDAIGALQRAGPDAHRYLAELVLVAATQHPANLHACTRDHFRTFVAVVACDDDSTPSALTAATSEARVVEGGHRRRRRRVEMSKASTVVASNAALSQRLPSVTMAMALSLATLDGTCAAQLRPKDLIDVVMDAIDRDCRTARNVGWRAARLHRLLCVVENCTGYRQAQCCTRGIELAVEWVQRALDTRVWLDDADGDLHLSVCAALRLVTNVTNGCPACADVFHSRGGIDACLDVIRVAAPELDHNPSSAICDLMTCAFALLINCAEVHDGSQDLVIQAPVVQLTFELTRPSWEERAGDEVGLDDLTIHLRTLSGYVCLLIGLLSERHGRVVRQAYPLAAMADILDRFSALTRAIHPKQAAMIAEIDRIASRVRTMSKSCT